MQPRIRWAGIVTATLCVALAPLASAEDVETSEEEPAQAEDAWYDVAPSATGEPDATRGWEIPPGPEPEDFALAVPRAALAPLWLLTTGLAYPLDGILIAVEETHLPERMSRFFRWNEAGTAGWRPVVSWSFNDGLSGGVDVYHGDLGGFGESLTYRGRVGGLFLTTHEVSFLAERLGGSRLYLEVTGRAEVAAHRRFEGLGAPSSTDCGGAKPLRAVACETRFREHRGLGLVRVGGTFGRRGKLFQPGVTARFDHRRAGPATRPRYTSIDAAYDTSRLPGYGVPVSVLEVTADFVVDTRRTVGLDPVGFRMEVFGGGAPPVAGWRYWHYGLEAVGTIDLFAGNRLLVLRAMAEAVHGPPDAVPFQHLVTLGGADRLRGYRTEALRDARGALVSVEYRWPIHHNVRAFVHTDVGRVGPEWSTFVSDWAGFRPAFGGGFLVGSRESVFLRAGVAYGNGVRIAVSTDLARAFQERARR